MRLTHRTPCQSQKTGKNHHELDKFYAEWDGTIENSAQENIEHVKIIITTRTQMAMRPIPLLIEWITLPGKGVLFIVGMGIRSPVYLLYLAIRRLASS